LQNVQNVGRITFLTFALPELFRFRRRKLYTIREACTKRFYRT